MSNVPNSPRPLPGWLKVVASAFAVGHLVVIGLNAVAAPSGPYPFNAGPISGISFSPGPQFAKSVTENATGPTYLHWLRMNHNYHFAANKPAEFAVYFEVRLKGPLGEVRTLKFPDEKANFWVRHRQEILAQNLVPDRVIPPQGNEKVAPEGQELAKVEIWMPDGPQKLRLTKVPENDPALRKPPVEQASAWSQAMVRSYLRYLCREHNAVSAELIRHSRRTVLPMELYVPSGPDFYNELHSNFGEYP
jgi:hypothetical protein